MAGDNHAGRRYDRTMFPERPKNKTYDFAALVGRLLDLPAETEFCEFKHNFFDPVKIGQLVTALSNSACLEGEAFGYLIWGIEDGTKKIVGTNFEPRKAKMAAQDYSMWLAQQLQPSIEFNWFETVCDEKRIVGLRVKSAADVPTKFQHISYIRIGSGTPKLSDYPARETALVNALRPFVWERGVAASAQHHSEILELIDWQSYYTLIGEKAPGSESEIIERLKHEKIVSSDLTNPLEITNLGAVLFARNLADFDTVTRKAPRVIQYEGNSRTKTIREQVGVHGYAIALDALIRYVSGILPQREIFDGATRKQEMAYPQLMVREAIVNALMHQDFTISGTGPVIEIFKDRVEITNPGKFLIDPQRVIDLPPRSRNELIAAKLRRMNMCEERGSGADKIVECAESSQLPAPIFRTDGDSCRVTLFGPRKFKDTTTEDRVRACYQHSVLRFLKSERMTNASFRQRIGIEERNAAQVSRIFQDAAEARLIKQADSWSVRSGTYVPFWA